MKAGGVHNSQSAASTLIENLLIVINDFCQVYPTQFNTKTNTTRDNARNIPFVFCLKYKRLEMKYKT